MPAMLTTRHGAAARWVTQDRREPGEVGHVADVLGLPYSLLADALDAGADARQVIEMTIQQMENN